MATGVEYRVAKEFLAFSPIGKTEIDQIPGYSDQFETVFKSKKIEAGSSIIDVGGILLLKAVDGTASRISLVPASAKSADQNSVELSKLRAAAHLVAPMPVAVDAIPDLPSSIQLSALGTIHREDLSPEYQTMMDETEEFRLKCFEEGNWNLNCGDIGVSRRITLSVIEPENQISVLTIEFDPISRLATVNVPDPADRTAIDNALFDVGIALNERSRSFQMTFPEDDWARISVALSRIFVNEAKLTKSMSLGF